MVVQCLRCEARYRLDESRIKGRGAKVTCPACKNVFRVMKPVSEATASEAEAPAAPIVEPEPVPPVAPTSSATATATSPTATVESGGSDGHDPRTLPTGVVPAERAATSTVASVMASFEAAAARRRAFAAITTRFPVALPAIGVGLLGLVLAIVGMRLAASPVRGHARETRPVPARASTATRAAPVATTTSAATPSPGGTPSATERARVHLLAGQSLLSSGLTAEALDELRAAVALEPGFAEAHRLLGGIHARAGRRAEACLSFDAYLRLVPAAPETATIVAERDRLCVGGAR